MSRNNWHTSSQSRVAIDDERGGGDLDDSGRLHLTVHLKARPADLPKYRLCTIHIYESLDFECWKNEPGVDRVKDIRKNASRNQPSFAVPESQAISTSVLASDRSSRTQVSQHSAQPTSSQHSTHPPRSGDPGNAAGTSSASQSSGLSASNAHIRRSHTAAKPVVQNQVNPVTTSSPASTNDPGSVRSTTVLLSSTSSTPHRANQTTEEGVSPRTHSLTNTPAHPQLEKHHPTVVTPDAVSGPNNAESLTAEQTSDYFRRRETPLLNNCLFEMAVSESIGQKVLRQPVVTGTSNRLPTSYTSEQAPARSDLPATGRTTLAQKPNRNPPHIIDSSRTDTSLATSTMFNAATHASAQRMERSRSSGIDVSRNLPGDRRMQPTHRPEQAATSSYDATSGPQPPTIRGPDIRVNTINRPPGDKQQLYRTPSNSSPTVQPHTNTTQTMRQTQQYNPQDPSRLTNAPGTNPSAAPPGHQRPPRGSDKYNPYKSQPGAGPSKRPT